MTRIARSANPLDGVDQVLVDGTNFLHALSRDAGAGGAGAAAGRGGEGPGGPRLPPAALIGRLRAVIPPEVAVVLVFDGPPERGIRGERIAAGLTVRYGGRHSGDTILVTLVEDAAMADPSPAAGDRILVVTDDRELRVAIRRRGARTAGTSWLIGRLERSRLAAPAVGNRRPPTPPRIAQPAPRTRTEEQPAGDGPRWQPGRGATAKRGNPRRPPKGRGDGR